MFARANDALTLAPPARKRVELCVTMRNRILFERAEIDARTRTVTLRADDARATHAREVLRSDVGDRVRAGTIDVGACEATIATSATSATLERARARLRGIARRAVRRRAREDSMRVL